MATASPGVGDAAGRRSEFPKEFPARFPPPDDPPACSLIFPTRMDGAAHGGEQYSFTEYCLERERNACLQASGAAAHTKAAWRQHEDSLA
jgi:hypothetical protein